MPSWKSIHVPGDRSPNLLVKARLDKTGYSVHLTDLSRVWSETLTKREVERRAIKEDCSIDPGEDAQQYSILLDKLRSTLDQQDGTTLTLKPTQQEDGLLLVLSAPLPHPLQPLKWTVRLALQAQDHVATELVQPLIRLAQTQQVQIQQLIHELGEKDRIVAKLTDRLETSGNDLTTVFPGVSNVKLNRKKTQREQLARHVRGLGDFDQAEWTSRMKEARASDLRNADSSAMEAVLTDLPEAVNESHSELGKDWWKDLNVGHTSHKLSACRASSTNGRAKSTTASSGPASADDDHKLTIDTEESFDAGFQRQGTPPHLKRADSRPPTTSSDEHSVPPPAPQPAPVQPEDESTEDESDLDTPIKKTNAAQPTHASITTRQRSATPAVPPEEPSAAERHKQIVSPTPEPYDAKQWEQKPRGRLGAIGGRARTSATPATESKPEQDGMETDASPAPGKSRIKLGKIGGKSKAPSPTPEEPASTSHTASPPKHRGLGTIGGKKAKATSATTTSPSRQASETPSAAASITTPDSTTAERKSRASERRESVKEPTPPRETSQERADRKRNELKRQLDEKARVPVKKKRKF